MAAPSLWPVMPMKRASFCRAHCFFRSAQHDGGCGSFEKLATGPF
jgi:hypothetical protein